MVSAHSVRPAEARLLFCFCAAAACAGHSSCPATAGRRAGRSRDKDRAIVADTESLTHNGDQHALQY